MTKELSLILLQKINDAPYLDRKSGLVQTFDKVMEMTDAGAITKRIPVTAFATLAQCNNQRMTHMIPDSSYKGMVYFEDYGTRPTGPDRSGYSYSSNIRLVCWLNTNRISGSADMLLSAVIINDLIKKLTANKLGNYSLPRYLITDAGFQLITDDGIPLLSEGGGVQFTKLNVTVTAIPVQDNRIFSKYDYSEKETQYLMSPFEYFAIDLSVNYSIPAACGNDITVTETPATCL